MANRRVVRLTDQSAGFITNASASTTYLTQASASVTYLSNVSASTLYLPQVPGIISQYIGVAAPNGYLLCDGSPVSRTTYSALWDVLRNGTSSSPYGNGDGTTTFNLPNLKGRVPVGIDDTQTEFDARGETGGSKTSTAPHDHSVTHDHAAFNATSGGVSADHSHGFDLNIVHSDGTVVTGEILNVGIFYGTGRSRYIDGTNGTGDHTHTTSIDIPSNTVTSGPSSASASSGNLQPYITVNYIIKY